MSSPFLYRNVPEPLGSLLAQAGAGAAPATLLIPDLQRPHVDHVVPYAWWERHPNGDQDKADANSLGNCMLLHANFNLARNATPAGLFLEANATDFKNDPTLLDRLSKALLVSAELLDATKVDEASVRAAVATRTTEIRRR